MFTFLKTIKWFEWMGLGAIVLTLVTGYLVYSNYEALKIKFAISERNVQISNDTINRQVESAKITDQSQAEHSQEKAEQVEVNAKTRQEVIDEYLDSIPEKAEAVAEGAPGPETVPDKGKVEVPKTPITRTPKLPPVPKSTAPDPDADRLSVLSQRMHERYCRAYSNGTDCSAE